MYNDQEHVTNSYLKVMGPEGFEPSPNGFLYMLRLIYIIFWSPSSYLARPRLSVINPTPGLALEIYYAITYKFVDY